MIAKKKQGENGTIQLMVRFSFKRARVKGAQIVF